MPSGHFRSRTYFDHVVLPTSAANAAIYNATRHSNLLINPFVLALFLKERSMDHINYFALLSGYGSFKLMIDVYESGLYMFAERTL